MERCLLVNMERCLLVNPAEIIARFPEGEFKEWSAFNRETLDSKTLGLENGTDDVSRLTEKAQSILKQWEKTATEQRIGVRYIRQQYKDFRFTMKEKQKMGALWTLAEMVTWTVKNNENPIYTSRLPINLDKVHTTGKQMRTDGESFKMLL